MSKKLPTRLGKSPLVDAIFEIRFDGDKALSSILTGLIYAHFSCTDLERLPQADIPDAIRANDQNLKYALLNRMKWRELFILTGDRSVLLSSIIPYLGWEAFKNRIDEIVKFLCDLPFIRVFERFSFKYIDILDESTHKTLNETLNISISIGKYDINEKTLQLRSEIPIDNGVHIVQIVGNANALFPTGKALNGIMVSIDSIMNLNDAPRDRAKGLIAEMLTPLHDENKELFFEMLTESGLAKLEPEYD